MKTKDMMNRYDDDNDAQVFMRWSDGVGFAIPFLVNTPGDIVEELIKFREMSDKNAHLHVFIPHSGGGCWVDPLHLKHIIAPGSGDKLAVRPHATTILKSGLISEEIIKFSADDCVRYWEAAQKTFQLWATDTNHNYTKYAMRDSLTILRADLVENIRRASNDDLIPSPLEENDPEKLRTLAFRYGLKRDFERAYPEEV